ncbi:hypothetical protein LguiB_030271 [Lonicera macranthoides]
MLETMGSGALSFKVTLTKWLPQTSAIQITHNVSLRESSLTIAWHSLYYKL